MIVSGGQHHNGVRGISPPVSTPLEPCLVAPYVNLPVSTNASGLRNIAPAPVPSQVNRSSVASGYDRIFSPNVPASVGFTAFDSILTAAQQVGTINRIEIAN